MGQLGRLTKIDLREHWQHEALDFTRWLSLKENLDELSAEVGLGIQVVQTEANVGKFFVDILAEEEGTGRRIIIENQLESTDHSHLGQIITYAAGLGAEYILWVVKQARDEHRQAVEWLNEHTDEKVNVFLVKVELWRIGDSLAAPKFTVVSGPNNWTKVVRRGATDEPEISDTKAMQLEFWEQLRAYAAKHYPQVRLRAPRPQHWYDVAVGRSDCQVALSTNTRDRFLGCEIYIPKSKEVFHRLQGHQSQIEADMGAEGLLSWQELESKKAARIRMTRSFDFSEESWDEGFVWLLEGYLRFKKVVDKYL